MMEKEKTRKLVIVFVIFSIILMTLFFIKLEKPNIFGAVVTRVFVSGMAINNTCEFELIEGWNLISIPCTTDNSSINFMLESLTGRYSSIHTYDTLNQTDHWKSYNPNLPSWVAQDLVNISEKRGYWIKMDNHSDFIINGRLIVPNTIQLYEGWNLVGYPANKTENITDAFSSIMSNIGSVHMYNSTDTLDKWKVYNPNINSSLNDLEKITSYFGYWINMTTTDILVII